MTGVEPVNGRSRAYSSSGSCGGRGGGGEEGKGGSRSATQNMRVDTAYNFFGDCTVSQARGFCYLFGICGLRCGNFHNIEIMVHEIIDSGAECVISNAKTVESMKPYHACYNSYVIYELTYHSGQGNHAPRSCSVGPLNMYVNGESLREYVWNPLPPPYRHEREGAVL